MRFLVGDRVQHSSPTATPVVGIVQSIIRVPPARWDTEGMEQISHQVLFPTIRTQAVISENNLRIALNPLV